MTILRYWLSSGDTTILTKNGRYCDIGQQMTIMHQCNFIHYRHVRTKNEIPKYFLWNISKMLISTILGDINLILCFASRGKKADPRPDLFPLFCSTRPAIYLYFFRGNGEGNCIKYYAWSTRRFCIRFCVQIQRAQINTMSQT